MWDSVTWNAVAETTTMSRCVPFAALVVALVSAAPPNEINLEEIFTIDPLVHYYSQCLLDKRDCGDKGEDIKSAFKEAILNDCASCTPKQKATSIRGITFLIKQRPQIWHKLISKYDPQKTFAEKHPEFFV